MEIFPHLKLQIMYQQHLCMGPLHFEDLLDTPCIVYSRLIRIFLQLIRERRIFQKTC